MTKKIKKFVSKVSLGVLIFILFNTITYSMIVGNWADCGFGGGGGESKSLTSFTIRIYIIEGAGYFLNSHSSIQALLNRVELSELNVIDFNEMREILYKAIEDMEKAKDSYYNLKQEADKTPYNPVMINFLLNFDYNGFREEKGLNLTIFENVNNYLSRGDIRGIFSNFLANSESILEQLYTIKEWVDAYKLPKISSLWRLNQDYVEAQLFGQYTSEIFHEILSINKSICP
jgi:hypothetical protein